MLPDSTATANACGRSRARRHAGCAEAARRTKQCQQYTSELEARQVWLSHL